MVQEVTRRRHLFRGMLAFLLFFVAGLAATRLLYEATFPRFLWLARPLPVLLIALGTAIVGRLTWRIGNKKYASKTAGSSSSSALIWTLTPLLLNLIYLFDPAVDLVMSRFIFAASIWLTALFISYAIVPSRSRRRLGLLFIAAALPTIYLLTMPQAVGSADTFEFQVVIPQMGIAHPTGYPLYLLLGRLFAFIPYGTMAWRINLASAVFATLAAALLYLTGLRLLQRPLPALLAAVLLGLTPVLWSQAIEAEVYALHALFICSTLWLLVVIIGRSDLAQKCTEDVLAWPPGTNLQRLIVLVSLLLGLGLTNHLTTLFLFPPAIVAIWLAYGPCLRQQNWKENLGLMLKALAAFLLPLLLYAYLPLRWSALHDESMGLARFVDWVIGGRFQGALQLTAWLNDLTRYEVVGRLILSNWGWFNLVLVGTGVIYLLLRRRRTALVLLLTWLGFIYYALNYLVPDLAVFIIPAHIVMALFWAAGVTAVIAIISGLLKRWRKDTWQIPLGIMAVLLLLLPSLVQIVGQWPAADNSKEQLMRWGEGVLALPLDDQAAILADSEKIAPLYYLQQAEEIRPDLDIMVLPDEAAYRAQLDARVSSGQSVYLARFLPGLEGVYHLRSIGPLIEVSSKALTEVPDDVSVYEERVGPLHLMGYTIEQPAAFDPSATAVTLYWRATGEEQIPQYIYVRWSNGDFISDPDVPEGQHPATNYYPTSAWRTGEIVPDFHLLARPISAEQQTLDLQVAAGPPFSSPDSLEWQTITRLTLPPSPAIDLKQPLRAQFAPVLLSGVEFPSEIRPQTALPLTVSGYGVTVDELQFSLEPLETAPVLDGPYRSPSFSGGPLPAFVHATEIDTDLANGRFRLMSREPESGAICGWLIPISTGCSLGEVQISGVPLPDGAVNFEDKIALLDIEIPNQELQPGGQLPVNLRWQTLSAMEEDYTVFLQVLDAQDRIVGQVDAWPLHGTYATSQWTPGEIIDDPHLIQLDSALPPGSYRLQVGWYLLSTLRRLPVLDDNGLATNDKLTISNLTAVP
ncbi:MAG: DUF2723 domain-containing protein [Candidatus Promineifilaceae bacterium]|nr:DUF2723 domain-containing protein [Candidatus Promineifilaceae bacterium]